jgi:hypothetical protein
MLGCTDSGECLNPGGTVRQLLFMVPPYGEIAQFAGSCVGRTSKVDTFCLKTVDI